MASASLLPPSSLLAVWHWQSRLEYSLALYSRKYSFQASNLSDSGEIEKICSQKKIFKPPIQHMEKGKKEGEEAS